MLGNEVCYGMVATNNAVILKSVCTLNIYILELSCDLQLLSKLCWFKVNGGDTEPLFLRVVGKFWANFYDLFKNVEDGNEYLEYHLGKNILFSKILYVVLFLFSELFNPASLLMKVSFRQNYRFSNGTLTAKKTVNFDNTGGLA